MSDISRNIYVSAGGFASPFFNFYTDASGMGKMAREYFIQKYKYIRQIIILHNSQFIKLCKSFIFT